MGVLILICIVLIFGIGIGCMMGFSRAMREAARNAQTSGGVPRISAPIVIILGTITIIAAICFSLYTWHFVRKAQRTTGTVIEMVADKGRSSDSRGTAPVFQFHDVNGQSYTITSSLYSSPPEFRVGDVVSILYLKENPRQAHIDSFWQLWFFPVILGFIGVVDLLAGTVFLFWPGIIGRFRDKLPQ
ncbi:MAG TPA: DUF3592 domain-containing protein [Verrucomicrobiae bacterium]|jgi:hypothetical protein